MNKSENNLAQTKRDQPVISHRMHRTAPKKSKGMYYIIIIPPLLVFMIYVLFKMLPFLLPEKAIFSYQPENAAIDAGLAIVSIAISVWIGLNIYNLVSDSRVSNIEEDIHTLKRKTKVQLLRSIDEMKNQTKIANAEHAKRLNEFDTNDWESVKTAFLMCFTEKTLKDDMSLILALY
ncbi:MAG: hypothetical protein Q4C12_09050 [Clostridia bacterium]|nr:hypothetical protein [Clostridia bacterium]